MGTYALRTIRNGDRAWSSRYAGARQEDAMTRDEYDSADVRIEQEKEKDDDQGSFVYPRHNAS
jgi:hypothetical protein